MEAVKTRLGRNIRYLREKKKITLEQLADILKISAPGVYSYERGRTEPNAETIINICKFFDISIDAFLLGDFAKTDPTTMMKMGNGNILFPITIDKEGKENIQLVSIKARAGYTAGYNDPEFISALPSFQLPFLPADKSYRAFQLHGDSMHPIPDKAYVLAEYVELKQMSDIKDGHAYIVVTKDEGVVFKVIYKQLKTKKFLLRSLNKAYEPYEINTAEVMQIWKFVNYISNKLPDNAINTEGLIQKLDELRKLVMVD